mmetsp:Transcript_70899/g.224463  ORF Transcript_70899/g.224463 Transcript_70899/m.224463 type:complete len:353 (+) Transcript_70899:316-1374(+)
MSVMTICKGLGVTPLPARAAFARGQGAKPMAASMGAHSRRSAVSVSRPASAAFALAGMAIGSREGPHGKAARLHAPRAQAVEEIELDVGGGDGGDMGGDGGDGSGDGEGEGSEPAPETPKGFIAAIALGYAQRMQADPNFLFKICCECMNDAAIIIVTNWAVRKERFFKEIEFVFCHLSTSLLCDAALVTLLAPVAGVAAIPAARSGLKASIGRLPANVFQKAAKGEAFTLGQRAGCYLYKGAVYGGIGAFMGTLGGGLITGLSAIKKLTDPDFVAPKLPSPLHSSWVWASYVGISSNTRYQTVAGLERAIFHFMPGGAAKATSWVLRLGNNFIGSASYVWWSRVCKLDTTG